MYNKPISDVSNRIVSHGSAWADNVTGHPVLAAQLFRHFGVLFLSGLCRSYRGNRTATKCTLYLELQVHVKIISKCFWITTLSDTMPLWVVAGLKPEPHTCRVRGTQAAPAPVLKCAPLTSVFVYSPSTPPPSPIDIFILVLHPHSSRAFGSWLLILQFSSAWFCWFVMEMGSCCVTLAGLELLVTLLPLSPVL